jgi:UPF0755 protein
VAELFFDRETEAGEASAPGEPTTGGKPRRRSWLRRWLSLLVLLAVLGLGVVVVGALWVRGRVDPPGPAGEEVELTIRRGATSSDVAEQLADLDVITDATIFRYYLRLNGGGPFKAGDYTLRRNSAMGDVVETLEAGPALPRAENLTVPEGLWVEEVAAALEEEIPRLSSATFAELAAGGSVRSLFQPPEVTSLEGLLYPETYRVEVDDDEAVVLARMVAALDANAAELGYADAPARVGVSPYEALVVASLVEAEAKVDADRGKIARVVYNRLAQGMPLGIDATVYFALGRKGGALTESDLDVDSPYNTRRVAGLPPTPIAMPGRKSLEAAINPEPGPWLYYVLADEAGNHAFSESYDEFLANRDAAREKGLL